MKSKKDPIFVLLRRLDNTNVHNFSKDKTLDKSILSLGIRFIPHAPKLTLTETLKSVEELERNLLLKLHKFPNNPNLCPKALRVKSKWVPTVLNINQRIVKTRFNLLRYTLPFIVQDRKIIKDEVTQKFIDLRNRKDIKVVQTDKNLGIAILNIEDYHRMVLNQLLMPNYKKLTIEEYIDPRAYIKHIVDTQFAAIQFVFNPHELKFVYGDLENLTYIAIFHGIPKVHKNKPLQSLPIRPIVAGRLSQLQARVSVVLTERLLPKLAEFEDILTNSVELKNSIEGLDCTKFNFISIDFESLYTSIPLLDLYKTIETYNKWLPEFRLETVTLLKFIFNNNYFEYMSDLYKQTDGIAMGTNVAPVIANIYLAIKFDTELHKLGNIKIYKRYIDDCFILYKGSREDFEHFELRVIEDAAKPINVTYNFSAIEIDFLDTTIFKVNDKVAFKIFQKPLNKYNYLPMMTLHPINTIKGFITGEILRYFRLSTRQIDFFNIVQSFYSRLIARGYTSSFLQKVFLKGLARVTCPVNLPTPVITVQQGQKRSRQGFPISRHTNLDIGPIIMILRYSNQPILTKKFKEFVIGLLNWLSAGDKTLPQPFKFMIAFRKNPNVINLAIRSALSNEQKKFILDGE